MRKQRLQIIIVFLMIICSCSLKAQSLGINADGSAPDSSAMLDVKSTNKGFLAPRVTSTANITLPATGLLVYQTGSPAGFYYYNGLSWTALSGSPGSSAYWNKTGTSSSIAYKGTSDTLATFNYLDGSRNGLKLYSPYADKNVQLYIDRGYNVAALNTNAATTEIWANSWKQMSISMGKIDCQANNIVTTGKIGIGTATPGNSVEINSGIGGVSGLRLAELPNGAILFMSGKDVSQNNNNLFFDATNYRLGVACGSSGPNSTLQTGGSFATAITTKTSNYTASNDHTILCNGTLTIALPNAAGASGRIYVIKNIGSGTVTISAVGYSQTIDGASIQTISTQYQILMLQSDGNEWYIIGKNQ